MSDQIVCTVATCPLSESVYGYLPSVGGSIFFAVFFGVALLANIFYGFKYKQWSFMTTMVITCALESAGNGTRLLLRNDPFGQNAIVIQLVLLTIAPVFLCAALYFCLKYVILLIGPGVSRLPAAWYTYIFITCDVISLALQGIGGGIAAGAPDGDTAALNTGNNVMMAGLGFQVATLTIFAILSLEYAWRVWRDVKKNHGAGLNAETVHLRTSAKFKGFVAAIAIAYIVIMIRCIYRLVEMGGGWGNHLMQEEVPFIILECMMIAISVLVFLIVPPGMFFVHNKAPVRAVDSSQRSVEAEKGSNNRLASSSQPSVDNSNAV